MKLINGLHLQIRIKIILKYFLKSLLNKHKNFIFYCFIGLISILIDISIFRILINYFHLDYKISNFISVNFGIINSFLLNKIFNYKTKDHTKKRFISFYLIGLLGLIFSTILLQIFVDEIKFEIFISKYLTIFIISFLQYLLNNYITFKKLNK
jgi:putative flippase GtrA